MLDSKGIIGDFPIYRTFLKIRAEKCEFAVPDKNSARKMWIRRTRQKFGQKSVNSPYLINLNNY